MVHTVTERIGFRVLLGLMVPFFFLAPWMRSSSGALLVATLQTAILAAAALAAYKRSLETIVCAALAAIWLVELWSRSVSPEGFFGLYGIVAGVLMSLGFTALVLRRIFEHETVTVDTIIGSLCAYLLMGLTFGLGYGLIEEITPNSFTIAGTPYRELSQVVPSLDQRLFYFSFVTITTLGYGDVAPVAPLAQSVAVLEAICGAFYLAVLVARLVSVSLTQARL